MHKLKMIRPDDLGLEKFYPNTLNSRKTNLKTAKVIRSNSYDF